MALNEGLVIDPTATVGAAIDLNPLTPGLYGLEQFDPGLAAKRPEWLQGGDADGSALMRNPYHDQAQGSAQIRIWPAADGDMDAALAAIGALTQKMQECPLADNGLPVLWTPAKAATGRTMYWQLAEFDGAPPIDASGELAGWFVQKPVLKLKFSRRPFLYAPEIANVTDNFGSNSIANYTFDGGVAGNVSVGSGTLNSAANPTVEERPVLTTGTYTDFYDAQLTVKATLGTTLSGFKAGVVVKRIDASNYVEVYVDDTGAASRLRIDKVVAGVRTNLQSTAITRLTVSTAYWVRGRIEGNTIYAEHWTAAPTNTGTAANAPAGYALTAGAEQTAFGQGVAGKRGLVWVPQQAAATLDDFTIEPNLWVSTGPALTGTLPGVPGDVAAEARLPLTDKGTGGTGQSRQFAEWGLQCLHYQGLPLIYDSDSLVTSGFAGTQTTRTGAWDPDASGNNVIRTTLTTSPIACCSTGNLGHIGTFRVRARCYPSSTAVQVRLSYQEGAGAFRPAAGAPWTQPPAAGTFVDLDLGLIDIPVAPSGATQQWSGRIEAYSPTAGDTLDVDFIELIPAGEGYGKVRAPVSFETLTAFSARDEFDQSAGNLNAKVAPVGGTWATAGSTTDFVVETTGKTAQRSTVSDSGSGSGRLAVLGSTSFTDVLAQVDVKSSAPAATGPYLGLVTRYVDASNYAALVLIGNGGTFYRLSFLSTVAGVGTDLTPNPVVGTDMSFFHSLRCQIDASGRWWLWFWPTGGAPGVPVYSGVHTPFATGGVLATGKPGLWDYNPGAGVTTRNYDNFLAGVPTANVAVFAGRTLEFRSDQVLRQDSTGTYLAQPPFHRSAPFLVPPAGSANRTSRVLARALRNDPETMMDGALGDNLQAQCFLTPRFLTVPR